VFQGRVVTPDGKMVLTQGQATERITVWNIETGRHVDINPAAIDDAAGAVTSIAFSPDGKMLVTGTENGKALLWNAQTGALLHRLYRDRDPISPGAIAFAPDSRTVLVGVWDASLWDARTGRLLRSLKFHKRPIESVAFAPDGKTVLTGGRDDIAVLWDVRTGAWRHMLNCGFDGGVVSVAFAPDGKTALIVVYGKVLHKPKAGRTNPVS
jgi:WD40 repeat protein